MELRYTEILEYSTFNIKYVKVLLMYTNQYFDKNNISIRKPYNNLQPRWIYKTNRGLSLIRYYS